MDTPQDRPAVEPVIVTTKTALTVAVAEAVERALRKTEPKEQPPGPGFGWITNVEAMRLLGLSKPTLQRYRADGLLPYSKVGSSVYYRLDDVEALLARHVVGGA